MSETGDTATYLFVILSDSEGFSSPCTAAMQIEEDPSLSLRMTTASNLLLVATACFPDKLLPCPTIYLLLT
jgi:hypothetical protein